MNTLMRIGGTVLFIAGGIVVYDLANQDALIGQALPLLAILTGQVLLGVLAGALMRSWRAVAIGPMAFVAGYLAAAPLQSTDLIPTVPISGSGADISALAGGSLILGTIFFLTLLCCLLAVGTAIGTTRGIRRQKRAAWRRAHTPLAAPAEAVVADLARRDLAHI